MSVPCSPTPEGLPVGLQIMARTLEEGTMLAVAAAWENAFRESSVQGSSS
jgi:Asp-tRNA(Asn)/Glu-tRNA(Gln) amidotransferase A subunit family amidase